MVTEVYRWQKTCQCLNKFNRTWDAYVKTVAVFSNAETMIVLMNTGVMVTSFLLGNNILFSTLLCSVGFYFW